MVRPVAAGIAHIEVGNLIPLFKKYSHVLRAQTTTAILEPFLEGEILKAFHQPPLA